MGGDLRSKTRTITKNVTAASELPHWNYDGSSCGQAPGTDSEVYLVPRQVYKDPFRPGCGNLLVMCDCYEPPRLNDDGTVTDMKIDANLSVLSMIIVKKGETEIPGLTDDTKPRRLGPKRASKIRKLFMLSKEDDVRQYVIKRPLPAKEGKENKKQRYKAPKIQRLVTPAMLQRKRHRLALKRRRAEKNRQAAAEYAKILAQRQKEANEAKELKRKRSASLRESKRSVSSQ